MGSRPTSRAHECEERERERGGEGRGGRGKERCEE